MTVIKPNLFFESLINSSSSSIFTLLNHSCFPSKGTLWWEALVLLADDGTLAMGLGGWVPPIAGTEAIVIDHMLEREHVLPDHGGQRTAVDTGHR